MNGLSQRLLGRDRPEDLAVVLATFVAYLIADRWTSSIALVRESDLTQFSLVGAAIAERWWLLLPLLAAFAVGFRLRPASMLCRWSELEGGTALRILSTILIVLLSWQAALYNVNFLADRVHGVDRPPRGAACRCRHRSTGGHHPLRYSGASHQRAVHLPVRHRGLKERGRTAPHRSTGRGRRPHLVCDHGPQNNIADAADSRQRGGRPLLLARQSQAGQ